MKHIRLGQRVKVTDASVLSALLRQPGVPHPEPEQMAWAGRTATVTGYSRGADGAPGYVLDAAPGIWREDWIDPV